MEDFSRVEVFEALQDLVDDVLLVDLLEDVGSDDGVEVDLHRIEDEIDVSVILSANHIQQSDDVLVAR